MTQSWTQVCAWGGADWDEGTLAPTPLKPPTEPWEHVELKAVPLGFVWNPASLGSPPTKP